MTIYETDTNKLLSYNGTSWVLPTNLVPLTLNRQFQVFRNSSFSVPNSIFTNIPMPLTNENSIGSGTWNGTVFTIGVSGLYSVSWSLAWDTNVNGTRLGYIWDGSTMLGAQGDKPGGFCTMSGQVTRRFSSGTNLSVTGFQDSGASINVIPTNGRIYFNIVPLF